MSHTSHGQVKPLARTSLPISLIPKIVIHDISIGPFITLNMLFYSPTTPSAIPLTTLGLFSSHSFNFRIKGLFIQRSFWALICIVAISETARQEGCSFISEFYFEGIEWVLVHFQTEKRISLDRSRVKLGAEAREASKSYMSSDGHIDLRGFIQVQTSEGQRAL